MEQAYQFAAGPVFRFCFALMALGLLRKILLFAYGMSMAMKLAGDRSIAAGPALREGARWLMPLGKASPKGAAFAAVSVLFHAGLLLVPLFLEEHLLLLRGAAGIYWPALPAGAADALTVIALLAALYLLASRALRAPLRKISGGQDYGFLGLIVLIFLTGLLASRPFNPFSYSGTMLVHAMAGNMLMAFLPFSKMAHGILLPAVRYLSLAGWKLSPGSPGRIVREAESPPPDGAGA